MLYGYWIIPVLHTHLVLERLYKQELWTTYKANPMLWIQPNGYFLQLPVYFLGIFILLCFLVLIQGMAGAGGVVLSKSIPTDMFTGKELAKYIAIISAINGIAPVISPVIGGLLLQFTNWKGIFIVLLGIGVVILILSYFLKESLPVEKRSNKSTFSTFISLGKVFRNPTYVYNTFTLVMAAVVLFSYIAASPFIIQEHYGYSPLIFSLCFALNSLGIVVGSIISMRFKQTKNSIIVGSSGLFVFSLATAFLSFL